LSHITVEAGEYRRVKPRYRVDGWRRAARFAIRSAQDTQTLLRISCSDLHSQFTAQGREGFVGQHIDPGCYDTGIVQTQCRLLGRWRGVDHRDHLVLSALIEIGHDIRLARLRLILLVAVDQSIFVIPFLIQELTDMAGVGSHEILLVSLW